MKLATFDAGQGTQTGIVVGDLIIPIAPSLPEIGTDMKLLIEQWDNIETSLRRLESEAPNAVNLETVRLLAPVQRPGKIMAIGLNYADHIAESNMAAPERQIWFSKAVTSVNGPYDPIDLPAVPIPHVDYEAELVAVIGKGGRSLGRDDAPKAIFGYCVGNDVTERAWQHATPQWVLGKSFDTHAPFGPWITTADAFPEPHGHNIRCSVNGEIRQNSNTKHLVFDVWAQIEHLSTAMTLEAGDIIYTGTPGGVGAAMKPMVFLKHGDVVRVEIDGLGSIEAVCKSGLTNV
jgi:ureidoglycolate lyase